MKKRILSILLVVCLCAALLPGFAAADTTIQGSGTEADPWILTQDSFTNAGSESSPVGNYYGDYLLPSGSYKLGENINLNKTIQIGGNASVTLDLNGHTLTKTNSGQAIEVSGTLTLNDSSDEQSGVISGGKFDVKIYGTFNMTGGRITSINNYGGEVTLPKGITLKGNVENTGDFSFVGNTFEGVVRHAYLDTERPIDGGTFLNGVENGFNSNGLNKAGLITGGVFYGIVCNYAGIKNWNSGSIDVCSEIRSGVFYKKVTNMMYSDIDVTAKAKITGGVFYDEVENKGEITGGVFFGGITENQPDEKLTHKITVDLGNGTTRNGIVVGDTLYPLGEPPVMRAGYKFVGWFDENGNEWDFEMQQPTSWDNFKLTAKWEEIPTEDEQPDENPDSVGGLVAILDDIPFVDVDFNDYFYDSVKWAYHSGVTGGTDAWHFSPDAGCTRAEAVTFLWRAAGSPKASYLGNFTDVDADAYYAPAVAWAVANGVTNGTSATTFSPDAACSRSDIVTFLYRAFGGVSNGYTPFTDVAANAYYADAVAWAYEHNVTGGTSADKFSPADACSRAQIVTFLYRVLG